MNMPQTVIDLVSSPELPPTQPVALRASPSRTSKPRKPADNGIVELFSDDDEALLRLDMLSKKDANATIAKPAVARCEKPSSTRNMEPTVATCSNSESFSVENQPASGLAKVTDDFHFLSDDFDSTVNFDSSKIQPDDDPFADDLPPLKRRKVSPPAPPKPQPAKRISSGPAFKASTSKILESDPVVFTSSPDPFAEAARRRAQKRRLNKEVDEHDEDGSVGHENTFNGRGQMLKNAFNFVDDGSESDLPDIDQLSKRIIPRFKKGSGSLEALEKCNADKAKRESSKDKASESKSKEDKAAEKARKAREKAAAKEAEKEQKALERERKKRDKEVAIELARVNLLKTDKKVSTPEMIVDLPSSLDPILREQASAMLRPLDVECSTWEIDVPVIKWRRKVVAEYDEEADHYVPVPKYIRSEGHAMCVLKAQALVDLITGTEGANLDSHVLKLQAKLDNCKIIYLIEGHNSWMKKNRNLLNRQFDAAARSHGPPQEASQSASQRARKKKKEPVYVAEDLIEDAMLRLQIVYEVLIHHTNSMIETAEWVVNFTQHISSIPYK